VEFVRKGDGESMAGTIERDGSFSINVPAGFGTLTIDWSCRRSVHLVETLTLPEGRGIDRTYKVAVTPADTLCRRESEDLSDTSRAAVARWISRGPCFAVAVQPWRPRLIARVMPPAWVRLDSVQPAGAQGSDRPLHYEPRPGSSWRYGGWRPLQGDSIQFYWNEDFMGISLTLGPSADSLAGRGMLTDDIVITDSLGFLDRNRYPNGPASAHRVPCR
jgi:hypothetical protein